MRYIPHTDADVAQMLRIIGASSVEELFSHIPAQLRLKKPLDIEALDEVSLMTHLGQLGARSTPAAGATVREGAALSFLGAGLIPHHVPVAVDMMLQRAEWYTSYTPYQPEVAQGTLQAVFEYQTLVSELFGPSVTPGQAAPYVSNASMYDGASATAEAVLMARRITGRSAVVACGAIHPQYLGTLHCYLDGIDSEGRGAIKTVGFGADGRVDLTALATLLAELGSTVACVLVQSPNYLGVLQDVAAVRALAKKAGALTVVACPEPLAFGLVKSPGSQGADIVAGEGIGLASGPSLGGPGVGLFAARSEHVRQIPGRLVGETVDQDGRRGYVLTLATREQHIRREKATSNICTNQGLIALAFAIHLCMLGKSGFRRLAELNLAKSEYLKQRLQGVRGFRLAVSGPTFNEIAVTVRGQAADVALRLREQGIFAGVPLDQPGFALPSLPDAERTLLIATTERHRREDIDHLVTALDEVCP